MEAEYLNIAIQYYVAGRSAVFANAIPVAGNLFHHAIEMLLKYFLYTHYSERQLKDNFGHNLEKLWHEFKSLTNDPALTRFDALVSSFDEVEDLRYPRKGYVFTISWRKGPQPTASGPATKSLTRYHVNLEEIDEFVSTILTGRVTPGWIKSLLQSPDAKAQYSRENLHPFFTVS